MKLPDLNGSSKPGLGDGLLGQFSEPGPGIADQKTGLRNLPIQRGGLLLKFGGLCPAGFVRCDFADRSAIIVIAFEHETRS